AAEVLKVGAHGDEATGSEVEQKRGVIVVAFGAIVAAALQVVTFTNYAAAGASTYFRFGLGASGLMTSYSLALIGAGHLVGISVGVAMIAGLALTWGVIMPWLTQPLLPPDFSGNLADVVNSVRGSQVRFIGAGTIGVAAIWSLIRLVGPLARGMINTARAGGGARSGAPEDQDLSLGVIGLLSLGCLAAIGWLLFTFLQGTKLEP